MRIVLVLLAFCFSSTCIIAQIPPDIEDIEKLRPLLTTEFDSAFRLAGLSLPLNLIEENMELDKVWTISGPIVDFVESIGCGSVLCTAGTIKVLLRDSVSPFKEEFAYVVKIGLSKDWVLKNKEVSLKVRYLNKFDINNMPLIFNKFETNAAFLILE